MVIFIGAMAIAGCTLVPKPLTHDERWLEVRGDRLAMFADQAPLTRPLTLEDAFARALKYNLDGRVKAMEQALAANDLDLSRYDLLPKLAITAAQTSRNNVDASSSEAIASGQQSLVPSTSTDVNRRTADLTLSWNILDFGVSYFVARQQADRVLIAQEQRRKVVQTLLQEIRRAYWRAVGAQILTKQANDAVRAAKTVLASARSVESEILRSPIDSLRNQKALLDTIRTLENNQQALVVSKVELAALINLPPGQDYALAVPGDSALQLEPVQIPVAEMENTALLLNPDIRALSYESRISVAETRKQLLKLLPGVTLSYDPNFDSNSFAVNHYWVAGAARVNGYLSNLLTAPVAIPRSEYAEKLAIVKRQAMDMAVLAKLHIAYQQYLASIKEYNSFKELASVDQRLYQQIANRTETDAQSELERILAQTSAVDSNIRRYQSFADAQAALGRLYQTLGIDLVQGPGGTLSVSELSSAIHQVNNESSVNGHPQSISSTVPSQNRDKTLRYPAAAAAAPLVLTQHLRITEQ